MREKKLWEKLLGKLRNVGDQHRRSKRKTFGYLSLIR